jgi:2-polyprenyl-6-methoxyphenol hydroxylase-like FAD-dependent oxidoreductase
MRAEATDLLEERGRTVGVRTRTPTGAGEIRADLVVGADGRSSFVRTRGGLIVDELGARLMCCGCASRKPTDPNQTFGHIEAGAVFVMLDREEYWQCGYVIAKGDLRCCDEFLHVWSASAFVRSTWILQR